MKNRLQGSLALICATVIWGSAFIAQRVGMELIGPFTFQVCRCLLAVLFLFPMTLLFDLPVGIRQSLRKWKNPRLWRSGLVCGCALFVAASLQQVGLVSVDAGKAGFLTAMYIVLVPVLGIFVHRKPGLNTLVSVVLAVIGLYLLSYRGSGQIRFGDILLIGCAFAYSVQILLIDRFAPDLDGLRLNCVQALTVAVISLPFMLFTEEVDAARIFACRLPIGYAGVLSMGLAYSLQITGQQKMEPTAASLIMSMESVFAALFGMLILHETMTPGELTGCAFVFAGVILSQLPIHPNKKQRSL